MPTRSRIINDARAMAGNPADAPLPDGVPESLCYTTVNDLEEVMLNDVALSNQKRRIASQPIPLNDDQVTMDFAGIAGSAPVYAQLQLQPDDIRSQDVEIVNFGQLEAYREDRRLAIAFEGDSPAQITTSWKPDSTQTLTVWFERWPEDDPAKGNVPAIDRAYVAYLKWQLAAFIMEKMKQPIGDIMKGMLMKSEAQWHKFTRMGPQSGIVRKRPWRAERYPRRVGRGNFPMNDNGVG